ncbi:MAG TPA: cytidine/deoxycytidylate deaminase family protein [Candidatus Woesebacteria bacterium]|nr:cytidine/deoxycytidylate deaminase family protein [Candidatus Woesebacteria bacterium]
MILNTYFVFFSATIFANCTLITKGGILTDQPVTPPRVSWDEYFIKIANTVAERATCDRGMVGCVIVHENHIVVTGYVGSPPGLPHCHDVGHQIKETIHENGDVTQHCVRTIHAEQNAIVQAARIGVSIKDTTLYCRMTPCRVCAMLIIGVGIRRVVCEQKYHAGAESEEMFRQVGIELVFMSNKVLEYPSPK